MKKNKAAALRWRSVWMNFIDSWLHAKNFRIVKQALFDGFKYVAKATTTKKNAFLITQCTSIFFFLFFFISEQQLLFIYLWSYHPWNTMDQHSIVCAKTEYFVLLWNQKKKNINNGTMKLWLSHANLFTSCKCCNENYAVHQVVLVFLCLCAGKNFMR